MPQADDRGTSMTPSPFVIVLTTAAMISALYGALLYAPPDDFQGDVQRILYLHVTAALTMYLAITLVFVASVLYLQRRDSRWDEVAAAAAALGLLFGNIVMGTGPLWGRPVWGTYWTWDARLTSFFILWMIFVGYSMLRSYGGDSEQVARFCSVLAVLGFVGLPITHYSVVWFRTLHPQPVIMTEGGGLGFNLPQSMLIASGLYMAATVLLFVALFSLRLRLERQGRRLGHIRRQLDLVEAAG